MAADTKRAVAWVKHHAADLQIRPDRVVLAGGSAGAHLALLAAYAPDNPTLTPAELGGSDPPVCEVVSLYGQADLAAHYHHTGQQKSCRPDDPRPDWDAPPPPWMLRLFGPDADRPHTDHAFDLLATAWSPPARVAIHVLERFLAVLAATDQRSTAQPVSGSPAEREALSEARSV